MNPVLDVRGLNVVYHTGEGVLPALHDVSFSVQPGEFVGIVGESGCGKSTVASALMQLLPPNGVITHGSVNFQGRDLRQMKKNDLRQLRGRELAMIFQDPLTCLNPVFTIRSQILDVVKAKRLDQTADQAEMLRQVTDILEKVGIPDVASRLDDYPHQFSGGMRQRIMIAMALIARPALLIADEPTSALDVTLEAQILDLLRDLQSTLGTAVLLITHDLGVIAQQCERVLVMYAGRVVEQQETTALFENPLHPYTRALLAAVPSRRRHGQRLATIPGRVPGLLELPAGCKFAERCPLVEDSCRSAEPEFIRLDSSQVRCVRYQGGYRHPAQREEAGPAAAAREDNTTHKEAVLPQPGSDGEAALVHLEQVSTFFKREHSLGDWLSSKPRRVLRAVDRVSLEIDKGEIIGLVGESGSGKTTLGRTILGLLPPSAGKIEYAGQDITLLSPGSMRRLRRHIQMVFQDPVASLSPRMRVNELLLEPYRIHNVPPGDRYSVEQLLDMVGLSSEQAQKYPHELSGGQARRVSIARALALHPAFLIADEPTSGLDVSVASSILNLMQDLAHQLNLTYLIITHNLNTVGYIADRVAVMYLGRLVESGPAQQLFDQPNHPYTIALLSSISEPDPHLRNKERRFHVQGEIPSPLNPPGGCHFHPRCPFAQEICHSVEPELRPIAPKHQAACHFSERIISEATL